MKSTGLFLFATALLMCTALSARGFAQAGIPQGPALDSLSEEFQSLNRIFTTLDAGDTVYTPFFPMWSVLDRGLKLRVYSTFRNHNIAFSTDDPVYVIAT